eukprot:15374230-Alexandrium_andersonii.AAC.1
MGRVTCCLQSDLVALLVSFLKVCARGRPSCSASKRGQSTRSRSMSSLLAAECDYRAQQGESLMSQSQTHVDCAACYTAAATHPLHSRRHGLSSLAAALLCVLAFPGLHKLHISFVSIRPLVAVQHVMTSCSGNVCLQRRALELHWLLATAAQLQSVVLRRTASPTSACSSA